MKEILLVGFGGGFGCIARYLCSNQINTVFPSNNFPWATITVNTLGCFIIGLLSKSTALNQDERLLLCTGFLGGFTTFSTFGLETVNLIKNEQVIFAASNIFLSVILGITAIFISFRV